MAINTDKSTNGKDWLVQAISGATEQRNNMVVSQKYYNSENVAIMERRKCIVDSEGNLVDDPYKANYKLPSAYHKLLIEQKVNYSLNSSMTAEINGKDLSDILGKKWKSKVSKAGREASKNGFSVWQFYLEDGKVKYKAIPSEQIILCMDGDRNVIAVIRLYDTMGANGKTVSNAEVWDDTKHWHWTREVGAEWSCMPPEYHLVDQEAIGDNVVSEEGKGWGRPPFAIFLNNEELHTDLKPIKALIDVYDFVNSDFANNLDDFQELHWIIKNYGGTDLSQFIGDMKMFKAVKVGDDGDAKQVSQEIPHEARKVFMADTESKIFKFGMGVNADDIEGNVTNVRIKAMYGNLDLKANSFELNCTEFLEQSMFFYGLDPEGLEVTYDRKMIINEIELSTLANQSIGSISEKTRLENEPRVTDVPAEMEAMKAESEERARATLDGGEDVEETIPTA